MSRLMIWIAMLVMAGMLTGISSGNFVNDPIIFYKPEWTNPPVGFVSDYTSPFGCVKPFNLSAYMDLEREISPQPEIPPLEPLPLVIPEPLPVSKADLFKSMTTISSQKQSLISSLSTGKSLPVSF